MSQARAPSLSYPPPPPTPPFCKQAGSGSKQAATPLADKNCSPTKQSPHVQSMEYVPFPMNTFSIRSMEFWLHTVLNEILCGI